MHTPRLCIDGRAARDFRPDGLLAQELIDQLVASQGEETTECGWGEKQRTVLLSHPDQVFTGQLKRFDTKKKIGSSFLYWAWEKNFIENANISAFHRFRPAGRLEPSHDCPTITTILPEYRRLYLSHAPRGKNHRFVVPSDEDKQWLSKQFRIDAALVTTVRPSIRRYVQFVEPIKIRHEGWLLLLTDGTGDVKKLRSVLAHRYPRLQIKKVSAKEQAKLSPGEWMKLLENSSVCFYLHTRPFDWPFFALEANFLGIPMVFPKANRALTELLPGSSLELSRFLMNLEEPKSLMDSMRIDHATLLEKGIFESFAFFRGYDEVYSELAIETKVSS